MEETLCLLKHNALFQDIKEEDIAKLLDCLSAKKICYREKENIFLAGSKVTGVGIVLEGEVHIVQEDYLGNRSIIASVQENRIFGEAFVCAGIEELPVSVYAARDSTVLLLGYAKLLGVCPNTCIYHRQLIFNMLKVIAQKNIALNQKLEFLAKRTTREKLLAYLSKTAGEAGTKIFRIPFNRQELADFLCVDRSAMSGELGKLRDEGILEFHKNSFRFIKGE